MGLIRTTLLSTIGVLIKILSMLTINKLLAIYLGPTGYPIIGQFQNFLTTISAVASGGIGSGVTKYTAEYVYEEKQKKLWSTSALLTILFSTILSMMLLIFNKHIARYLLIENKILINIVAISLPLYAINTLLIAILNGKRAIGKLVLTNISNNLIILIVVGAGIILDGMRGALLFMAISQAIVCIPTLYLIISEKWFKFEYLIGGIQKGIAKSLLSYSIATLITSIIGPASLMVVRTWIIKESGIDSAGYWDAIIRIGGVALIFISTPLSVYFIPRISEINNKNLLIEEIYKGYLILIPVLVIGGIFIYLSRDLVIKVLLTNNFYQMRDLFGWQIIGDVLRAASWILSYYLLAKALINKFILIEIFFSISYITLNWILISNYGVTGAPIAYAVNNLFYLFTLAYVVNLNLKDD